MRLLPASPRRRRRLAWSAAAGALVAAIVAVVLLAPSTAGIHDTFHGKPQPIPTPPRPVAMTPARRRSIDALLDRFVPTAVARRHVERSFALVTPSMRAGETEARWASGAIPVTPYPARGRRFHGWTLNYAFPGEVNLSLFLRPRRGSHVGPLAVFIDVRRSGRRWLVNSVVPAAQFSATGERPAITSERDLGPGGGVAGDRAPLSAWWIIVPLGVVSAPLLLALTFVIVRSAAGRRRRTAAAAFDDYFTTMRDPQKADSEDATPSRR